MRRLFTVAAAAAALAIPASIAGIGLGAVGPAGAAAHGKYSKITCTTITGNISSTITVSGCTGGATGGSSTPLPAATLAAGGTITWTSGSSTTISAPALKSTSAKKCPGYTKGGPVSAEKFTATVTGDTGDSLKIPGKSSGAVCLNSSTGAVTALSALKAS
jgi:hypothetical protein